jgi:branched-chain amino acid transport system ATP-binding protein
VTLLEVDDLHAGYGPVTVLRGISFSVEEGQTVALLGANGAGKTTTLRALSGMLRPRGRIAFDGRDIAGRPMERIVRLGVAHVPEGRGTFPTLTVEENLRLGAYTRRDPAGVAADMARGFELFPRLAERRRQRAGSLSGGEQQMLAIARALMLRPRLMLLDEPSLGLAPRLTRDLFRTLRAVKEQEGTTMVVVEQRADLVLEFADRAHVLETGALAVSGTADELRGDEQVRRAYLGY